MKKIKVMSVFGTRPETTKMGPVVFELKKREEFESYCCVTGQHKEMLYQALSHFNIKPDIDLEIMKERQTLEEITANCLTKLSAVLKEQKPDILLVHGDTTTSFAAALAAFYNKIPVGHVEAGLRSFDKYLPYPEELNRLLTDIIADIYFAPTGYNRDTLLKEGVPDNRIVVTGNTCIDSLRLTAKADVPLPVALDNPNNRMLLVEAHRTENLGEPMAEICRALKVLIERFSDIEIIWPVHLNPAVRDTVFPILGDVPRVHLADPFTPGQYYSAQMQSYMILSDSGGIQEEAPFFGKPVLVLRNETERPEAIECGTAILTGANKERIISDVTKLLTDSEVYNKMAKTANPFGDGHAAEKIADALIKYFA